MESRSAKKKKFDEEVFGTKESTMALIIATSSSFRSPAMPWRGLKATKANLWKRCEAERQDTYTLVTGSYDGTTKLWCLATGRERSSHRAFSPLTPAQREDPEEDLSDAVMFADLSKDGRYLVTAAYDGVATVWCMRKNCSAVATLLGQEGGLYTAQFAPDGQHVLTASANGVACLWHWPTQEVRWLLNGHEESYMRCASFSPDSTRIVTTSADCSVRIWQLSDKSTEAPTLVRILHGHWGWVNTAFFSLDGNLVLSAAADKTARIWCAHTGYCLKTFEGHYAYVRSAVFSLHQEYVLTASSDWTAKLWNISNSECIQTYRGHAQWVNMANFAANEEKVVTCSRDCTARLWMTQSGDCLRVFEGHKDFVMCSLVIGSAPRSDRWQVRCSRRLTDASDAENDRRHGRSRMGTVAM
eukprot:s191_g15.t1